MLTSCEHKELCYYHPHAAKVKVVFDWRDAPQADPDGMCVYFYPLEGGSGYRFDFNNTTGGEVDLRVGKYLVLCYNNDTEAVAFEDVYVGSPEISIRLEERGDYTLKVCADGTKWEGWFVY